MQRVHGLHLAKVRPFVELQFSFRSEFQVLYMLPVKVLEGSCPTMQLSLHAIYRVLCHMLNDAQFYPAFYTIRMRLAGVNVAM